MQHRPAKRCLTAFAALLAASCSSSSPKPKPPPPPLLQSTVRLTHVPAGFVAVGHDSNGRLQASFSAYGFGSRTTHAVRLLTGECSATGSATVATFPAVTADSYGGMNQGSVATGGETTLPALAHLLVMAGAPSNPGVAIGCANLTTQQHRAALLLVGPSGAPGGSAAISLDEIGKVGAHLTVTGLAAGSYAVRIHFGQCEKQSTPAANMGNASANAQGNIDATLSATSGQLDLRVVPWSVVVAPAGYPDVPVLCGDHVA